MNGRGIEASTPGLRYSEGSGRAPLDFEIGMCRKVAEAAAAARLGLLTSRLLSRAAISLFAFSVGAASLARAQQSAATTRSTTAPVAASQSATLPATQGVATQPASQPSSRPANVTPEAADVIRKLQDAITAAGAMQIDGEVTGQFDVAGRSHTYVAQLRSLVAPDGRFRHELVGYGLIVGGEKKITFYDPRRNSFATTDRAAAQAPAADIPAPLVSVLLDENPLLLLALTSEPEKLLASSAKSTALGSGDDAENDVLVVQSPDVRRAFSIDRRTHLMSKVTIDYQPRFAQRGAKNTTATVTIRYTQVAADAKIDARQFTFTPPQSATEFNISPPAPPGEELIEGAATQPGQPEN